jgi:serine/threonine-protein kinase
LEELRLPQAGDVIDGKYRIVRAIGAGGMGAVFIAHHELLQHDVALKVLLPAVAKDPQAVSRFVKEARSVARLRSPHVAAVHDIGLLPNGSAYISMEYLEGQDLATMLEERGTLPVTEAVDYVIQALDGLSTAHALGIVHRDIKPQNVFVMKDYGKGRVVKVLDFGIAKATRPVTTAAGLPVSLGQSMVTGKQVVGSPGYMSPEQLRKSSDLDHRSDIWSIGVTLYVLLTGQPPFKGETLGAIFGAILQDVPPAPSKVRGEVPPELDAIVMKCLQRKADARWQSAAELANALTPWGPVRNSLPGMPRVTEQPPAPAPSNPSLEDKATEKTVEKKVEEDTRGEEPKPEPESAKGKGTNMWVVAAVVIAVVAIAAAAITMVGR